MRENFRSWIEDAETYVLEVIFEERRGKLASTLRTALFGLSKVFELLVKLRRLLYNARILRDSTLGVQVIAVGNLTVGGTGKTPVVEKFARELQDQGRTVAILSRGYRSKPPPLQAAARQALLREDSTPPRVVSDGKSLLLDSETAGDEPYMLASNLKDVVVLVDKDRVKAGATPSRNSAATRCCWTTASSTGGCGAGGGTSCWWTASSPSATSSCSRAARCASRPRTWPAPTPSSSPRATATRRRCARRIARSTRRRASSSASTIRFTSRTCSPGERHGWNCVKGRKVASLSGIAQPESFEQSLVKLGAELVYSKRFADHHRFTQQEILNAINRSKKRAGRDHHHHAKGRGPLSQTGPARPADLLHARGNQDHPRRERLSGMREADMFPLTL